MKKNILPFLMSIFIYGNAEAQAFDWLRTVEVDYEFNPDMIQYTTCADPQGGSYFFGIQEHLVFYDQSMGTQFLKKYDMMGDEIWTRTIEGHSSAGGAVCDDAGNVFIFGKMNTNLDFWGEDSLVKMGIGTDGFLSKVSNEGALEWCINLTSLPMGEGTITDLAINGQDWLFAAYSTWINTYVLIFNPDGEYQQAILQQDVGVISGLDFDQEGNLFTTGSCAGSNAAFGGVSYPAPFTYTTYLVKYSPSFVPVWVKYIEDITCTFTKVRADEDGWVYFAGPWMTETMFDTILVHGAAWVYDFFLARLDPQGHYQWVRECPEVLTGDATVGNLHYLDLDPDGNALLTGITRGIIEWGNGIVSDVTDNFQDIIVWSYAPDGQVNWVKTAGGTGHEVAHTISAGNDGSAYLAGVLSGTGAFDSIQYDIPGNVDPFLAKLDLGIPSDLPDFKNMPGLLAYPNPADNVITFSFTLDQPVRARLEVLNGLGQVIATVLDESLAEGNHKITWNAEGLPPGIYICLLAADNRQSIAVGKIVLIN